MSDINSLIGVLGKENEEALKKRLTELLIDAADEEINRNWLGFSDYATETLENLFDEIIETRKEEISDKINHFIDMCIDYKVNVNLNDILGSDK